MITFYVGFLWSILCFFSCVFFFKYRIVFGLSLSCDFFVFIISFLDFIIVFKRINYPVSSCVNLVWVPLVFFS